MVGTVIHSVYSWIVSFCGTVFVIFAIAAIVMVLVEMILYRIRKKSAARMPAAVPEERRPRRIALITGASSGLGRQLSQLIDVREKHIDEIWLVARRQDRLEELAGRLQHKTRTFPLDLTEEQSRQSLADAMQQEGVRVGLLLNCAGLGKIGNYQSLTLEESDSMIELNDRAAVDMTVLALPRMQQGDRIIEICSTAAFQPIQHFNVYAASKSFLYNYSRGLRMELLPRRIAVTAVCPYWMKDTEFIPVARDTGSENKAAIRGFPFSSKSEKVAKRILRSSRMGFAVCTPGIFCTIHRFFSKLLPREILMLFWEGLRRV